MNLGDHIPPQALEAEQAVLGAMLMERDAIARVEGILVGSDFYSPQHQALYEAMVAMFRDAQPVDLVTLRARLENGGNLQAAGDTGYLIALQDAGPTAAAIERYANIVRGKSLLRALIRAGGAIAEMAQRAGDEDPITIAARAQAMIQAVEKRADAGGVLRWRDVLGQTIAELDEQMSTETHTLGIATGLRTLDDAIGGWQRGTYYVLAARPAIGKTAFSLAQCAEAAARGKRVVIFSLEMTAQAMARRHLARQLEIDLAAITHARFSRDRLEDVVRVSAQTQDWHLYICQRSDLSIGRMRTEARQLARRIGGLDLVAVDYLQLVVPDTRGRSRNDEVTEISAGLKGIAMELDCAVMALSQLSRDSERERRVPRLSDLRDSGSLEQDADVVLFLSWPTWLPEFQANGRPNKCLRRLDVAKQRNGPARYFDLAWEGAYQRFGELERDRGGEAWWSQD